MRVTGRGEGKQMLSDKQPVPSTEHVNTTHTSIAGGSMSNLQNKWTIKCDEEDVSTRPRGVGGSSLRRTLPDGGMRSTIPLSSMRFDVFEPKGYAV